MTKLISLIFCVKNGMPYIVDALKSIEQQQYPHFEVIVQDSLSDDGTLDVLQQYCHLPLDIRSEADTGIGDGYAKALARCSGDIIGSIDADNILMPDALTLAAEHFLSDPDLAVLYSDVQMLNADGSFAHRFSPPQFAIEKLLRAELVPPYSTSYFSSTHCGDKLSFDQQLKTCADFNLWLQLADVSIKHTPQILGGTRMSASSMTCDPGAYKQFCSDKIFALERFLSTLPEHSPHREKADSYKAGIFIWAAESLYYMEQLSDATLAFYNQARELDNSADSRTRHFEKNFLNP